MIKRVQVKLWISRRSLLIISYLSLLCHVSGFIHEVCLHCTSYLSTQQGQFSKPKQRQITVQLLSHRSLVQILKTPSSSISLSHTWFMSFFSPFKPVGSCSYLSLLFHVLFEKLFSECRAFHGFVSWVSFQSIFHFAPSLASLHVLLTYEVEEV